ncbi:hypothetical protein E5288_WYG007218 [Bos mutus]|uniref:Uncharacterized protein n=1 Tax=Bos mutus TaxID=72004 RepID=A0A6B0QPF8_9CETA|nr:hypothetical protein [Bos mutus]
MFSSPGSCSYLMLTKANPRASTGFQFGSRLMNEYDDKLWKGFVSSFLEGQASQDPDRLSEERIRFRKRLLYLTVPDGLKPKKSLFPKSKDDVMTWTWEDARCQDGYLWTFVGRLLFPAVRPPNYGFPTEFNDSLEGRWNQGNRSEGKHPTGEKVNPGVKVGGTVNNDERKQASSLMEGKLSAADLAKLDNVENECKLAENAFLKGGKVEELKTEIWRGSHLNLVFQARNRIAAVYVSFEILIQMKSRFYCGKYL